MRSFLTIPAIVLTLCYPFAIYFGINHISTRYLALAIACIFLLRFFVLKNSSSAISKSLSILIAIIGLSVCLLGIIFDNVMMMKLYPIFINLLFFIFFFHSLSHPPTVIERFARITNPELPAQAIHYTRKVTIIWCLFFIFNGLMAAWTAFFANMQMWTLYNGFISYMLIGLLFAGEFTVRRWVKRRS